MCEGVHIAGASVRGGTKARYFPANILTMPGYQLSCSYRSVRFMNLMTFEFLSFA